ncbi:MAG: hypothetical protein ABFD50_12110 [Smithella sp.]
MNKDEIKNESQPLLLGTVSGSLVTDSKEIEIGDTVKIIKDGKCIIEGEIEFIDFTIPFGTVILTIGSHTFSTGGCDTYLFQKGERNDSQKLIKKNRTIQVIEHIRYLDGGGKFYFR